MLSRQLDIIEEYLSRTESFRLKCGGQYKEFHEFLDEFLSFLRVCGAAWFDHLFVYTHGQIGEFTRQINDTAESISG